MANPLFDSMNKTTVPSNVPQLQGRGNNDIFSLISQFKEFRRTYKGDPRKAIEELVNSGKVSKEQLERVTNIAKTLQGLI